MLRTLTLMAVATIERPRKKKEKEEKGRKREEKEGRKGGGKTEYIGLVVWLIVTHFIRCIICTDRRAGEVRPVGLSLVYGISILISIDH